MCVQRALDCRTIATWTNWAPLSPEAVPLITVGGLFAA
jgi:hypothetical protein